jgi:hypothetical protein
MEKAPWKVGKREMGTDASRKSSILTGTFPTGGRLGFEGHNTGRKLDVEGGIFRQNRYGSGSNDAAMGNNRVERGKA